MNLNKLPIYLDEYVDIDPSYYRGSNVECLDKVYVKGFIKDSLDEDIEINLEVKGSMDIRDSINSNIVKYPFSFQIATNLGEIIEESQNFYEKSTNVLDYIEFLWENIVLEVPVSYTEVSGMKMEGNGWGLNQDKGGE